MIAIAADDRLAPLARANALGYLDKYKDGRAVTALISGAKSEHPAIRAVAVATLGLVGHNAVEGAAVRAAILAALGDSRRAVRLSALTSLINGGGGEFPPEDWDRFHRVSREFITMAQLYRDDAGNQRALGIVHLLVGESDLAAEALQISLGLEADGTSVKFLLALARLAQQRFSEARALLAQVPPSDPFYAIAQERLKMLEPTAAPK